MTLRDDCKRHVVSASQRLSVGCGRAIIASVPLRLSFDAIAVDDLVGTSAKDDAER